jgi:endonuclease III
MRVQILARKATVYSNVVLPLTNLETDELLRAKLSSVTDDDTTIKVVKKLFSRVADWSCVSKATAGRC